MASSAFKSTSKRSSFSTPSPQQQDSSSSTSSSAHRRSRSLSRYPAAQQEQEQEQPRGRFVNTLRGSAFPEISPDHFFPITSQRRGRSVSTTRTSTSAAAAAAERRGRSVSRPHGGGPRNADAAAAGGSGKTITDNNNNNNSSRRRRSLSVARYHFSDSQSDIDPSHAKSANINQRPSLHKPMDANHQRILRRSMSHKDLPNSYDGYSSHSSALTDDEVRDVYSNKHGTERTIRAVYAQKKTDYPIGDAVETGLYEAMRTELRHAVEEIRTELEHGMGNSKRSVIVNGDFLESNNSSTAMVRQNYATQLEQSEKRKQELLAEVVIEEQRGRELSEIVRELLPDPKNTIPEWPFRSRKSNDRSKISKCLTEEAEKYFDDFLSNVEDTDISSFDGERSDASSTLVGSKKSREPILHCGKTKNLGIPLCSASNPNEMDDLVLPWLQWETSSDLSPLLHKNRAEVLHTPNTNARDTTQGASSFCNTGNYIGSSHGSWSPGGDSPSVVSRNDVVDNKFGELGSFPSRRVPKESNFDMDEYLHIQQSEDLFFEVWRQRQRINSGALILCKTSF
ncbi:hypothetical protein GIB67_033327 [Kingdonia uniflora]|uniref:Uncharacterized protein n=1 Tax=Kingdonia uniflora TaxID=39325 RepID=A0A7J7LTT7_9MAGN|nr:hypothetical protein GIB67_033327 [Kingdonia uniflora]